MFGKVLVPLDGSALSEEVLPAAERLILRGAMEVTLLKAGQAPEPTPRRRTGLRHPLPDASLSVVGAFPNGVIPASVVRNGVAPALAVRPKSPVGVSGPEASN